MSHLSLTLFSALSVAAHIALIGLWPATEQASLRPHETSIEIGMVSLPQINTDFTLDHNRPNNPADTIKKQSVAPQSATLKFQESSYPPQPISTIQTSGATVKSAPPEPTVTRDEASSDLFDTASSSPQPDTSPAAATKAAPLYSKNPAPAYPATALRYGWEGEVWLKVVVNSSGAVDKITIEQSSHYLILDQAAVKTVRRWRFEPARIGNISTKGSIRVPIRFKIKRT